MTNEEKAREIRCYLTNAIMVDGMTKGLNLLSKRNQRCADLTNIYKLVEMSALQAMKWKDEQYNEEKRELLGLVKSLKINERNQTIIEDLVAMLNS